MAWIELHDTLPDHAKVVDLAALLRMDRDMVVGKLVRLWIWALSNRESGEFRTGDASIISEAMRFKGKPQVLIDSMVEVRLLDVTETGWEIHDWDERVGMLLAKREAVRSQTKERVTRYREQKKQKCNALQNENVTQCNAATIPYHTVPKPYHTVPKPKNNPTDCDSVRPQDVMDAFNRICISLPKVTKLTDSRKKAIRARNAPLTDFEAVFMAAEQSDFLSGRNGKWTNCGFDWLIKPTNWQKVLEGNYKSKDDPYSGLKALYQQYQEET